MKVSDILIEAVINYTLDNYTTMPRFTDTDMGIKYPLNSKMKLKLLAPSITPRTISRIYRFYEPGTIVKILGRKINPSGQHSVVVNPINTNDVYSIYGYYLQDPNKPLEEPTIRLKKRLVGTLNCGNCGQEFSLSVPKGTHRDHCPYCLYSVHIDNKPGDRNAWCGSGTHDDWTPSKLVPIKTITAKNGNFSIVYQCEKCNAKKVNKAAADDNSEELSKLPHES